jgi:RimJ/RimL family protein N-acetyltransferase
VASAGARLLTDWARRPPLGLVQVWCRIDPANSQSAGVAAAAGLVRLGTAAGVDVWASGTPPAPTSPA